MNHHHNNLFSFALLLVTVLSTCAPAARGDDHPLRMKVVIEPTTIHVYEALPITVFFQNTADEGDFFPVHYEAFRMGRGVGVVEIRDPAGATHTVRRPRYSETAPREGYWPVQPGDEFEISFLLSCGDARPRGEPIFTTPGTYIVTVEYEDRAADAGAPFPGVEFKRSDYADVHLRSEPIAVEVLDAPATERRALDLVKRLQPPIMLYEPNLIPGFPTVPEYERAMQKLREIASVDGSMIYANYARCSLAARHVRGARGAGRFPNYDFDTEVRAARQLLDAIDAEGFTLADRVQELRKELEAIEKQAADREQSQ